MAVVVEPVVHQEKLLALLAEQSEQSVLDYKRVLNLGKGDARDVVELAKDVAAMQAEPHGGYIVVGADDHGQPVPDLTPDLAKHFDDATLRQKLAKYLTEPTIRSARHEVNGHTVVLIHVEESVVGWSVFHAPGEYEDPKTGKKETVFRVGDVFVRHGTRSERWNDGDRERLISQIVARSKEAWRGEQAEEIAAQARLGMTVSSLQDAPSAVETWRLDADAFDELVTQLQRREDDIPLRRILSEATRAASDLVGKDQEDLRRLLDRLAAFAALAIHYERESWTRRVIATLERIYEIGFDERGLDRDGPCSMAMSDYWPTPSLSSPRTPTGRASASTLDRTRRRNGR